MKLVNFGSLNIDRVYRVQAFVRPGQTILARDFSCCAGGKGLNQSLAAARAGAQVLHAGAIGEDGTMLQALLEESGADTSRLLHCTDAATGHAVIQVEEGGTASWCGAARTAPSPKNMWTACWRSAKPATWCLCRTRPPA